jgi:glycosyltransferase involved in cell wall biosynthesis
VKSAQRQSYHPLEIIVVNDGSTDRTAEIVRETAAVDDRIQLLDHDNSGVAASRNRGLQAAAGEFVTFLDADDLIHATKVERQVERFSHAGPELGLVYCWTQRIDENGRVIPNLMTQNTVEGVCLEEVVTSNPVGPGSVAMMRRAVALDIGGFDETMRVGCEDNKFYARVAEQYEFAVVRKYLVGYRRVPSSMNRNVDQTVIAARKLIAEFQDRYPSLPKWRFRRALTIIVFWLLSDSASPSTMRENRTLLLRTLGADPLFMASPWFLRWIGFQIRVALGAKPAQHEPGEPFLPELHLAPQERAERPARVAATAGDAELGESVPPNGDA